MHEAVEEALTAVYAPLVHPVVVPDFVMPPDIVPWEFHALLANTGRGLQRSESGGRPWNFAIRDAVGHPLTLPLTPRQARLLSLWCVCPCPDVGGWLLCNLKSAEHSGAEAAAFFDTLRCASHSSGGLLPFGACI